MRSFAFLCTLIILVLALLVSGCDPIAKLAKSKSIADKDSAAFQYYRKGKYDRAVYLLEELSSYYRGTPRHRDVYYAYTQCKYKLGEFVMAAFYFNDFTRQYPRDEKIEEMRYLEARSYYLLADPWYLDPTYTKKAIEIHQLYLDAYPYSDNKVEATENLVELRERLAKKSFEQAKLYYHLAYYKAGLTAFTSFLNTYPDSKFTDEAHFLQLKSAFLLANASAVDKKVGRYEEAFALYEKFADNFSGSKFAKEAESLFVTARKNLAKIKKVDSDAL